MSEFYEPTTEHAKALLELVPDNCRGCHVVNYFLRRADLTAELPQTDEQINPRNEFPSLLGGLPIAHSEFGSKEPTQVLELLSQRADMKSLQGCPGNINPEVCERGDDIYGF